VTKYKIQNVILLDYIFTCEFTTNLKK